MTANAHGAAVTTCRGKTCMQADVCVPVGNYGNEKQGRPALFLAHQTACVSDVRHVPLHINSLTLSLASTSAPRSNSS